MSNKRFIVDAIENVITILGESHAIRESEHNEIDVSYFDSFDGRLFGKNYYFYRIGNTCHLYDFVTDDVIFTYEDELPGQKYDWVDFNEESLKKRLKKILTNRAMIQVMTLKKKQKHYQILDNDDKIVTRLLFEENYVVYGEVIKFVDLQLIIKPLKGYEKYSDTIITLLQDNGVQEYGSNILQKALKVKKSDAVNYSSKIHLKFTRDMSLKQATRIMLKDLVHVLKINEEGIIKDYDIEFLHDFRVSVRRFRSYISEVTGIFTDAIKNKMKSDFNSLGKATNVMRDLDVFLAKKPKIVALIPDSFHEGIEKFFALLVHDRESEKKRLSDFLQSAAYQDLIKYWDYFLAKEDFTGPEAEKNLFEVARDHIEQCYLRLIKSGSKITIDSPDRKIHALRIRFKKLRYMLEFFRSLYPAKKINGLIGKLKGVQDMLGDFSDLCVQEDKLKEFLHTRQKDLEIMTAASIGALITQLFNQQRAARNEFIKEFQVFLSPDNIKFWKKIIKN